MVKAVLAIGIVVLGLSIFMNYAHLNYFGLCPPQRLLFQKNAEGLLEPLSFLTEEQNLGTEVRDLVFRMNDRVCSAIGLERW
ncbi:hypothetical protein OAP65_02110 [Litorivicinus sp.]|jgi:hypothetical protein|nr:hypothetical protein [Litorivicinus sp.]